MKARRKIKEWDELESLCRARQREGGLVVFTNGCFDLLHVGHVRYLEEAAELGRCLVVGVNGDASVRAIKGPSRPVNAEDERSELVAALHCVDYVALFHTPTPLPLIRKLKPDILVKGADWAPEKIVGAREVREAGGRVARIPLVSGMSTTSIIERILQRFNSERKE